MSEDDTPAFCHKVSAALAAGCELHGDPTYAFDAERGVMRCGQSVAKTVNTPYGSDMKLGEQ